MCVPDMKTGASAWRKYPISQPETHQANSRQGESFKILIALPRSTESEQCCSTDKNKGKLKMGDSYGSKAVPCMKLSYNQTEIINKE